MSDPQPEQQPEQPAEQPPAQPAEKPKPASGPPGWGFRRTARTPQSDSWDIVDAESDRIGSITLQYVAPAGVEGLLALAGEVADDQRRSLLAWLTEWLALDEAAGPGGVIHWTTVAGTATDYWRRAPGRRPTGAEQDLAVARSRVEAVLSQMSADWGTMPDGDIAVDVGSVRVFVAIRLVDAAVVVRAFAITNLDVPTDGELPAYLLHLNFSMAIGRFSLDTNNGAVWFDHVLAGDEVDDTSLVRVIAAVGATADKYDDEIKQRFGGRTFRESGSPVEEAAKLPSPGMVEGYL